MLFNLNITLYKSNSQVIFSKVIAIMAAIKEEYLDNHKNLSDEVLLQIPGAGVVTPLTVFVCTYNAKLGNLHYCFKELTKIMCVNPHGCVLAVNSNYGYASQVGHEALQKVPSPERIQAIADAAASSGVVKKGVAARMPQHYGTCFNCIVEPIIRVDNPLVRADKHYITKCFSTTGETQVPGVILSDFSDGREVLEKLVDYLNELGVGDIDEVTGKPKLIYIEHQWPKMINFKYHINLNSPRILVNLREFAKYIRHIELGSDPDPRWVITAPPFPICQSEVSPKHNKSTFRIFHKGLNGDKDRRPLINVFQSGKINILGAISQESGDRVHEFFTEVFQNNWSLMISIQPKADSCLKKS